MTALTRLARLLCILLCAQGAFGCASAFTVPTASEADRYVWTSDDPNERPPVPDGVPQSNDSTLRMAQRPIMLPPETEPLLPKKRPTTFDRAANRFGKAVVQQSTPHPDLEFWEAQQQREQTEAAVSAGAFRTGR